MLYNHGGKEIRCTCCRRGYNIMNHNIYGLIRRYLWNCANCEHSSHVQLVVKCSPHICYVGAMWFECTHPHDMHKNSSAEKGWKLERHDNSSYSYFLSVSDGRGFWREASRREKWGHKVGLDAFIYHSFFYGFLRPHTIFFSCLQKVHNLMLGAS